MERKGTRASRTELKALITEVNRKTDIHISHPFPKECCIVLILYKKNKFLKTKRFDYLKLARDFCIDILKGESING